MMSGTFSIDFAPEFLHTNLMVIFTLNFFVGANIHSQKKIFRPVTHDATFFVFSGLKKPENLKNISPNQGRYCEMMRQP